MSRSKVRRLRGRGRVRRALERCGPLLVVPIVLGGCGGASGSSDAGQERAVFAMNNHESFFGPAHTNEIMDIVVLFKNVTDQRVRLTGLSLSSAPTQVRLLGTSVYDSRRVGYFPALKAGNLSKICPKNFVPSPVSSLVIRPHGFSDWFGVLAVRIDKPGRYIIKTVRISYVTPSGPGWQYQNANVTLNVKSPPQAEPRPPACH